MTDLRPPSPPLLVTKILPRYEKKALPCCAQPPPLSEEVLTHEEHPLLSMWPHLSHTAGNECPAGAEGRVAAGHVATGARGACVAHRRTRIVGFPCWATRGDPDRMQCWKLLLAEISPKFSSIWRSPPGMSAHHPTLLCVGMLLMSVGGALVFIVTPRQTALILLGIFLGVVGLALFISGLSFAMKNRQVAVPGHFLLHPRTGTRFNPQQAQAIQRRLDRIRREMSSDSVEETPEPEPPLPCTPPPWTMEPPPSYDTVMKSQEQSEQL